MPDRGSYIVTGGAGFIGSNLAAGLVKNDPSCEVIIVDDLRGGSYGNVVAAFDRAKQSPFSGRFVVASLEQIDCAALVATRGLRAVFHFAGPVAGAPEGEIIRGSVAGFEPLLTACVHAGMPLIYASSADVYGAPPQATQRKPFGLEAAGRPVSPLGAGKWLMECAQGRMSTRTALGTPHIVGLRLFDVFGPCEGRRGPVASVVRQLAEALLAAHPARIPADGGAARDLVFVDDVVAAAMAGLGIGTNVRPRPGVYNVGSGVATGIGQVLTVLRDELGIPESTIPTDRGGADPVPASTQADMSATLAGLGWKPATNPVESIRAYARWLKAGGC